MGDILQKFTVTFHVPGALGADTAFVWTVPSDCTLLHVSAVTSNDSDLTMKIGTSADDDGYLAACVVGDSATPVEKDLGDFAGALVTDYLNECPHITDGTIMIITIDYDGASGTAGEDLTIVLTFSEG